jgi:hypothetical protein
MRSRPIIAVAGLSLVVAVGGAFAADTERGGPAAPEPPLVSEPPGPAPSALVGRLRARDTVDDAIAREMAAGPLLADGAADVATARRVQPKVGRPGWLMEGAKAAGGRRSVCYAREGFLNCASTAAIAEQGVVTMVSTRGDDVSIEGIAVDGISAVDITLRTGKVVRAPVVDNVFLIEANEPPSEVRWQGAQGAKRQSFEWLVRLTDEAKAREQAVRSGLIP